MKIYKDLYFKLCFNGGENIEHYKTLGEAIQGRKTVMAEEVAKGFKPLEYDIYQFTYCKVYDGDKLIHESNTKSLERV